MLSPPDQFLQILIDLIYTHCNEHLRKTIQLCIYKNMYQLAEDLKYLENSSNDDNLKIRSGNNSTNKFVINFAIKFDASFTSIFI